MDPNEEQAERALDTSNPDRYVFRHNTIAHFKVGPFEFGNHLLTIDENSPNEGIVGPAGERRPIRGMSAAEKREAFLFLAESLKQVDRINIVELNVEALDRLTTPLSKAVRGVMQTGQISSRVVGTGGGVDSTVLQDADGKPIDSPDAKPQQTQGAGGTNLSTLLGKQN